MITITCWIGVTVAGAGLFGCEAAVPAESTPHASALTKASASGAAKLRRLLRRLMLPPMSSDGLCAPPDAWPGVLWGPGLATRAIESLLLRGGRLCCLPVNARVPAPARGRATLHRGA